MKTPEEIKKGLERCRLDDSCENGCPYHHEGCGDEMRKDALTYIKALEAVQQKWISVKERLPENEKSVLVSGWREGITGKLWPVVMTAFHMDGKMLAEDSSYAWSDGNVEMEYDEDADDFIVPEGWFEDVQCADEFSMVDGIRVTHWMPLPEPPKEEDNENA